MENVTKTRTSAATAQRRQNAADRRAERAAVELLDQGCTLVVGADGWVSIKNGDRTVYRTQCFRPEIVRENSPHLADH